MNHRCSQKARTPPFLRRDGYSSELDLLSSSSLSKNMKIKIYRTIILLVLCGCETWLLTVREECRLRVLRRIFGPKRDKITGVEKST